MKNDSAFRIYPHAHPKRNILIMRITADVKGGAESAQDSAPPFRACFCGSCAAFGCSKGRICSADIHEPIKTEIPQPIGCGISIWRSGRDLNPRAAFDDNTISSRARYDHFDTTASILLRQQH